MSRGRRGQERHGHARAHLRKAREIEAAKEAMASPEYWLIGGALLLVVLLLAR